MLGWRVIPRIGFGDFGVSPHGIGIAIGYFVGALVWARRARKNGFDEDHVWNAALWAMVGAVLGARLAYITGHLDQFATPVEWLKIWEGGISLVGGLLGGVGASLLYARRSRIDFFRLADLAAPGLAIGIAIGRIGDLMIGDHLGKQTEGWWGWQYQGGELISPPPCTTAQGAPVYSTPDGCMAEGIVVHQTALYDLVWSLVILGALVLIDRKPRARGFLFLSWMTLYALGRITTDFMRVDKTWLGLGLTGSQIASILAVALAILWMVRYRGAPPRLADFAGVPSGVGVPAAVSATVAEPSAEPRSHPETSREASREIPIEPPAEPPREPPVQPADDASEEPAALSADPEGEWEIDLGESRVDSESPAESPENRGPKSPPDPSSEDKEET